MEILLVLMVLVPLTGFALSLLVPRSKEGVLSMIVTGTTLSQLLLIVLSGGFWMTGGCSSVLTELLRMSFSDDYSFVLSAYLDKLSVVFIFTGAVLSSLVGVYSRYYLHREEGFKRFFNTVLFFFFGYNLTVLSGNTETLFVGWEVLGIASFLLIAFYRHRYLPVKNAVKVFSVYRVTDAGILLFMWASHHFWHESVTFQRLSEQGLGGAHFPEHETLALSMGLMLLLAASAKSALLPFTSWLPRAMEGPTPSSAIFYGSLAVHMGVFLLLRTHAVWQSEPVVRVLMGAGGVLTALVAAGIARVQSSVKSQVAYASASQIGLMFLELSLGWLDLALIHFMGNAFLRTYQLLVSPSAVSYRIREQFFAGTEQSGAFEDRLPTRLRHALYILSVKEWNLDSLLYNWLWKPLKILGNLLGFLTVKKALLFFLLTLPLALTMLFYRETIPPAAMNVLPEILAFFALLSVLKAFVERRYARLSLLLVFLNHCWIALAVSFNEHFSFSHTLFYLGGISAGFLTGMVVLQWMVKKEQRIDLERFQGHSYEYPKLALIFLFSCLAMSGFPITSAFIGEDLIFSHIHSDQIMLASFVAISFIVDGIALMRIYARVFLGPHSKPYHEIAFRSS